MVGGGLSDGVPGGAVGVGPAVAVREPSGTDGVPDAGRVTEGERTADGVAEVGPATVPVGRGPRGRVRVTLIEAGRLPDDATAGEVGAGSPVVVVGDASSSAVAAGSSVLAGTTSSNSSPADPLTIRIASKVSPEPVITTPIAPAAMSICSPPRRLCRCLP